MESPIISIVIQVFLAILGCVLAGLGTLVALQFKKIGTSVDEMSKSIIEMNTNLTVVITQHNNTESIAKKNLQDIVKLRERLHTIEGRDAQMLEFIKDNSKGS